MLLNLGLKGEKGEGGVHDFKVEIIYVILHVHGQHIVVVVSVIQPKL